MKKASISEAKNSLSALIDRVKGGTPVLIVDRGRPVAKLVPIQGTDDDEHGRLARLVREGLVRPAKVAASRAVFTTPPPRVAPHASAVQALIDERREGR